MKPRTKPRKQGEKASVEKLPPFKEHQFHASKARYVSAIGQGLIEGRYDGRIPRKMIREFCGKMALMDLLGVEVSVRDHNGDVAPLNPSQVRHLVSQTPNEYRLRALLGGLTKQALHLMH